MKHIYIRCATLFLIVLIVNPVLAEEQSVSVTLLEGKATVVKQGTQNAQSLKIEDFLSGGDRIRTDKKSRIELKLPDSSYIRVDEQTTFELQSAVYNPQNKERDIKAKVLLGKIWANVSKLLGGHFSISTETFIAGVRGTVYRMDVNQDNSATVKVYWGEVLVTLSKHNDSASKKTGKLEKPTTVEGPHPIAGPHPVSKEEWTYIIKSMQQIDIRPDGTAEKPFSFSAYQDMDDWVKWNTQRDKILTNPNQEEK